MQPWIFEAPPRCMILQRQEKYPVTKSKVYNNLGNIVLRGYIAESFILDLTYLFEQNKVKEDINMVFDAVVKGENEALWDPKCMLLAVGIILMMVGLDTHMVDLDIG